MERENARQEIRRSWRQLIRDFTNGEAKERVNGEPSFVCPFCGHGGNGDGLTFNPKSADKNSLKCFGCGWSGDIIDLCQKTTGQDYNTALSLLAGSLNISIDPYRPTESGKIRRAEKNDLTGSRTIEDRGQGDIKPHPKDKTAQGGSQSLVGAFAEYTSYYRACRERLEDPVAVSYLKKRGIGVETAAAYWIGFDPAADPANSPGGNGESRFPCPRLIIPTTAEHYVGRSVDPKTEKRFAKMNAKGSEPGIFNQRALYAHDVQEVFVVEGVFDALSILEIGAPAISLNSTNNAEKLIAQLESKPTAATLILCLDKDAAGSAAEEKLKGGLRRLNISYTSADICGAHKDPNEALVADRAAFAAAVQAAKGEAAAKPDNTSSYIDLFMSEEIDRFKSDIATGYSNLDKHAGGLYGGLYCLAAISSLGKTTFAAQMADQIAAAGNDVIFFSLEQSRLELVSKSLSRIIAQRDKETKATSLTIRKGYNKDLAAKAAAEYKRRVGDRVSVIEGNFNCDISFIGDYIRQYIRRTKTRPVVFIDYLQILQGTAQQGRQATTKEIVDSSVTELKRLSRELNIPIIIISSVNRANYLTPIDFESLKESGGIEYTCDVVWGLQLQCLSESIFDKANNIKERRERVKEAKSETPRKIELCCLKNRYGISTFSCYFDYYPANDLFEETGSASDIPVSYTRRI